MSYDSHLEPREYPEQETEVECPNCQKENSVMAYIGTEWDTRINCDDCGLEMSVYGDSDGDINAFIDSDCECGNLPHEKYCGS